MAVTIGIDHLLDGTDSSDSNFEDEALQSFGDMIAPVHAAPTSMAQEPETKEPELTGIALLQHQYQKDEERRRQSAHDQSQRRRSKIKLKIKIGSEVDIFSASQNKWLPGKVKEIQGDKLCIQYGNKIKWLDKKSEHLKFTRAARSNSLHTNSLRSENNPVKLQKTQSHNAYGSHPNPSPSPSAPSISELDQNMGAHPEKMIPAAFSDAHSLNAFGQSGGPSNAAPAFAAPTIPQMQVAHSHNSHFNPPPINGPPHNPQHPPIGPHRASVTIKSRGSIIKPRGSIAHVKRNSLADNVFVYTVEFPSRSMGVALIPYKDGKNCLVWLYCLNRIFLDILVVFECFKCFHLF